MKYKLFLLILILPFFAKAQSDLTLLNGKTLKIKKFKIDTSSGIFYYKLKLPSGKLKTKSLYRDEIFSVTDSIGNESIIYQAQSDQALNQEEMRRFVKGYGTGRLKHQSHWAMLGGFAAGFGGMFVSKNPFFSPIIPAAYVGSISIVKPNTDYLLWNDPDMELSPEFVAGYKDAAKKKNIKYAIIGSIEGIIIGTLVGVMTDYYN